jgi:2,3,4,5-tetrahydropyridine-2-carboxylate N-succinyltransferase
MSELDAVRRTLEDAFAGKVPLTDAAVEPAIAALVEALEAGTVRAATGATGGEWQANGWVKQGILVAFRAGRIVDQSAPPVWSFLDKHTLPARAFTAGDGVRIVPGGTTVRRGAHVGRGVILMPPAYVNVGAFVDEGTMIDSHALVGSCAQVGRRVHVSAAAQIGGVLEPAGARPVIVEDDVLVGGNCGVYEGTIVRAGAVLAAGVVLTASVPVYDLPHARILRAAPGEGLEIPARAVVVAGARAVGDDFARQHGLSLYAPIIVKYRDAHTDARTALESALR